MAKTVEFCYFYKYSMIILYTNERAFEKHIELILVGTTCEERKRKWVITNKVVTVKVKVS